MTQMGNKIYFKTMWLSHQSEIFKKYTSFHIMQTYTKLWKQYPKKEEEEEKPT